MWEGSVRMSMFENGCDAGRDRKWKELLAKYLRALPEKIEIMTGALDVKDMTKVETEVHKIKGTAGAYGLSKIAEAASQIESSIESQDMKKAGEGIEKLTKLIQLRISEL